MKYFGITLLPPTGDIKEEGRESARDEHLTLKAQNEQKLVFIILKGAVAFACVSPLDIDFAGQ